MTDWALIATSVSAGAATVGLIAREWQTRRRGRDLREKQLNDLVHLKVDAKLGERLSSFVDVRDRLENSARRAEQEVAHAQDELQASLDSAQDYTAQLNDLIERANEAIPDVMKSRERAPGLLLVQLRQSEDYAEQAALAEQILSHERTSSWQLEISGDIVQRDLQDPDLAARLYERACQEDPGNLHAKSELLELLADRSGEPAQTALGELIELAKGNPTDTVILTNALNALTTKDEWQKARTFIEEILPQSPAKAALWRNLAICRTELGDTDNSIREAYRQSIEFSRESQGKASDFDFVNAVRPYSSYLMSVGDLEEAERLLREAILYDPTEAQLHLLIGDIWRKRKEWSAAATWYRRAEKYASPELQFAISRRLEEIKALMEMDDRDTTTEADVQPMAGQ